MTPGSEARPSSRPPNIGQMRVLNQLFYPLSILPHAAHFHLQHSDSIHVKLCYCALRAGAGWGAVLSQGTLHTLSCARAPVLLHPLAFHAHWMLEQGREDPAILIPVREPRTMVVTKKKTSSQNIILFTHL